MLLQRPHQVVQGRIDDLRNEAFKDGSFFLGKGFEVLTYLFRGVTLHTSVNHRIPFVDGFIPNFRHQQSPKFVQRSCVHYGSIQGMRVGALTPCSRRFLIDSRTRAWASSLVAPPALRDLTAIRLCSARVFGPPLALSSLNS